MLDTINTMAFSEKELNTVNISKASNKEYEGNYTEEGLNYCQKFGDLYTNNDLRTLKPEIEKTIKEIQTTYGIKEYCLTWGWPMDYDAHIHLLFLLDKNHNRYDLIEKLNDLFPNGKDFIEVRYARD